MKALKRIKYWTLFLGILYILLGIWVFRTPEESYVTLTILFSTLFLINGISEILFYISKNHYGWGIAGGILDVLFGIFLLSNPDVSFTMLPLYVGFVLLLQSASAINTSLDLKNLGFKHWIWLLLFSISALIFSFVLICYPDLGAFTIVIWTALSLISIGISKIIHSLNY